jgi:Tfp pilus assembly protein PilF
MSESESDQTEMLPDDVLWALQRADGFMDMKMWDRAAHEMKGVDESHRRSMPFLQLELRYGMESGEWETARRCAASLQERDPCKPEYWVHLAYATRRVQDIPSAELILQEAHARFPSVGLIPYNLACYACCQGELDEANNYLRKAFAIDRTFAELAQEDVDLKPLWDRLDELMDL